jgi:hypothetical protein
MGAYTFAYLAFGFKLNSTEGRETNDDYYLDAIEEDEDGENDEEPEESGNFFEDSPEEEFDFPKSWKKTEYRYYRSKQNFHVPSYMNIMYHSVEDEISNNLFLKVDPFEMCVRYDSDEKGIDLEKLAEVWNNYLKNKEKILQDIKAFCDIFGFDFEYPQFTVWPSAENGVPDHVAFIIFGFEGNGGYVPEGYKNMFARYASYQLIVSINENFIIEDTSFGIEELFEELEDFKNSETRMKELEAFLGQEKIKPQMPKFYLNFREGDQFENHDNEFSLVKSRP